MILICTAKYSSISIDHLMQIFERRGIEAFRYNQDMFNHYAFDWHGDEFEIADSTGRRCRSSKLTGIVIYHARMMIDQSLEDGDSYAGETKWIISSLNHLHDSILCYGAEHKLLRLWTPTGVYLPKTYQMKLAKKYFCVPAFRIHWGKELTSKKVITKPLTQRAFASDDGFFAKIVDQSELDPKWPWFTQEIADGDRDATALYVNGKVHCYQFATVRGELTDWRITQGTDANQWIQWDAEDNFKRRIDLYMKDMKLKYGRLDFIIGGKEPQFLEVNPAGQFGWLDDEKLTLHNEVADAILDPNSTVAL